MSNVIYQYHDIHVKHGINDHVKLDARQDNILCYLRITLLSLISGNLLPVNMDHPQVTAVVFSLINIVTSFPWLDFDGMGKYLRACATVHECTSMVCIYY